MNGSAKNSTKSENTTAQHLAWQAHVGNNKPNQQISLYTASLVGPVILCGDFNTKPNSYSMKSLDDLENHSVIAKLRCTYQSPGLSNQTDVCDYILTREVCVKSFKLLDEIASDHKALLIETRYTQKRPNKFIILLLIYSPVICFLYG